MAHAAGRWREPPQKPPLNRQIERWGKGVWGRSKETERDRSPGAKMDAEMRPSLDWMTWQVPWED